MKKILTFCFALFFIATAYSQNTSEKYNITKAGRNYKDGKEWIEENLSDKGNFTVYKANGKYQRITVSFIYGSYSFNQDYSIKKCYPAENSPEFTLCEADCLVGILSAFIQIGIRTTDNSNELILLENNNPHRSYTPIFLGVK